VKNLLAVVAALVCPVAVTFTLAQDSPERSIRDGVYSAEQAAGGERTYEIACASCHNVATQAGKDFSSNFPGTLFEVFDLISNTMPVDSPGSLKPDEYAGIVAFFLKESGYKSGETPLPSDVEQLKKIKVEPLP
jgi:mono/diheme cytochrome c family protein